MIQVQNPRRVVPLRRSLVTLAVTVLLVLAAVSCGKKAPAKPGPTKQVVLKMKGMTCNGCVRALTDAFQRVKGAKTVKVTLKPPRAVIDYDSARANPQRFVKAAEKLGYGAAVTSDGPAMASGKAGG